MLNFQALAMTPGKRRAQIETVDSPGASRSLSFHYPVNAPPIAPLPEGTRRSVATLSLPQNNPNPFDPNTTISFAMPQPDDVLLSIYDLAGRQVRQLIHSTLAAGQHRIAWDGREQHSRAVGSGVYFCKLAKR